MSAASGASVETAFTSQWVDDCHPQHSVFRGLGAGAEEVQQGVAAVSGAWKTEMWDNRLFERKCKHVQFHGTLK